MCWLVEVVDESKLFPVSTWPLQKTVRNPILWWIVRAKSLYDQVHFFLRSMCLGIFRGIITNTVFKAELVSRGSLVLANLIILILILRQTFSLYVQCRKSHRSSDASVESPPPKWCVVTSSAWCGFPPVLTDYFRLQAQSFFCGWPPSVYRPSY